MRHPMLDRAAALAVTLTLAVAAVALADTVGADADTLTLGTQSSHNLGNREAGEVVVVPVEFTLACAGTEHLDTGQSVTVDIESVTVPLDGALTMDPVDVGPVPETWPDDSADCATTDTPLLATGMVTITAPTTLGSYEYPITFGRTPTPLGVSDGTAISGMSIVSFMLTVVDTTPPTFDSTPADIDLVTDDPAGAVATWVDPTATDLVDPTPVLSCDPPSGSTFLPGSTTVTCTATDASANSATATFAVNVGSATPPAVVPTAVFGPPIKENGLDGHAGRTIPMKVRLMLDGTSIGEGSLVLVVTPCDGGDPVAELEMDWRDGSQRWFGHLRTQGWEPGCYEVRAMHDGVYVGGTELRLTGKGPKADDAKHEAKVAEKADRAAAQTAKADQKGNAKGSKP